MIYFSFVDYPTTTNLSSASIFTPPPLSSTYQREATPGRHAEDANLHVGVQIIILLLHHPEVYK